MQKNKILKYSLIFGGLTALVCIIIALIQYYFLGKSPFGRYRVPAFGISLIFIFFSIWYYRIYNGGTMTFPIGFSVGFLTNLIAAIFTGMLFAIFVSFDSKPLDLWYKENLVRNETLFKNEKDPKQKEQYRALIQASTIKTTPFGIFLDEIAKKQLMIIAITLIAMALRRITVYPKND